MSIEGYIEKMKKIQNSLLKFLEEKLDSEENYENIKKVFSDQKMTEDKHELKLLLQLINAISKNHRRIPNFIAKVERIIQEIKNDIKNLFSNTEIFQIFVNNKRILLFLIKEEIVKIDEYIFSQITKDKYIEFKYPQYFSPEIKPFLTVEFIEKYRKSHSDSEWIEETMKEIPENFEMKRKEGENDNYMCELIRKKKTKDFIIYMNQKGFSFDILIEDSIFETNIFLLANKKIKLIEYASFFGSMEIIYFVIREGVNPNLNMWLYGIHSENSELVHYLEDQKIMPNDNKFEIILKESIRCHHIDVSKYIINYLIKEEDLEIDKENHYQYNIYKYSVEFCNYSFFPDNIKYKFMFHYLCEFGNYILVDLYLKNEDIDINLSII